MKYKTLLLAGLAYLAGSIPFSFLVARMRGVDLRETASGNLGAGNVWRECGFGAFLLALLLDIAKGALLPLVAIHRLRLPPLAVVLVGAGAMLGHARSIFMGFRGGKAVATTGGVLLAIFPRGIGAAALAWFGAVLVTRITSVGSLTAAAVAAVLALVEQGRGRLERVYAGFVCLAAAVVVVLHRGNIQRLREGRENRLKKFF
jgi:glycerol-3-phosphate acyltransferase PlsY